MEASSAAPSSPRRRALERSPALHRKIAWIEYMWAQTRAVEQAIAIRVSLGELTEYTMGCWGLGAQSVPRSTDGQVNKTVPLSYALTAPSICKTQNHKAVS